MYTRPTTSQQSTTTKKAIGLQGHQGLQGPGIGDTGPKGEVGYQGVIGFQGIQGVQGDHGPTGRVGLQGLVGNLGPQGNDGTQGVMGFQGNHGFKGDMGQMGPMGFQGWQGYQGGLGGRGLQGEQGVQGWEGPTGEKGHQGCQGFMGVGHQGKDGKPGPWGLQGHQGSSGTQGFQGLAGTHPCNAGGGSQLWYAMLEPTMYVMPKGSSGLTHVCLHHGMTGKSGQVFEVELGGRVNWSGKTVVKQRLQINLGATTILNSEETMLIDATTGEKPINMRGLVMLPAPAVQYTKVIMNGEHFPIKTSREDLLNVEYLSVLFTLINPEFDEDVQASLFMDYVLLRRL